jgi:hypothetical protein
VDAIIHKSRSVVELGKKFFYEQLEMDIKTAYRFVHSDCTISLLNFQCNFINKDPFKNNRNELICYESWLTYSNNSFLT